MRVAIFCVLFSVSTAAFGMKCDGLSYLRDPVVGSLAPSKANAMLSTDPAIFSAEILRLAENDINLAKHALEIGISIQKIGNESLIYNVDSLVYLARGSQANATSTQIDLYKNYLKVTASDSGTSPGEYFSYFQYVTTLRVVGSLALLGRTEEANMLNQYLSLDFKHIDAQKLHTLRSFISNTGKIHSAKNSRLICENISKILPRK